MAEAGTKLIRLIGKPVAHSLSPAMHNAAFAELGLDYKYSVFEVDEKDLESAVQDLRAPEVRGANVTMPHKVAVMQHLDEFDSLAEKIGAVNTIVNENGKLKGYNTDAFGALATLEHEKIGLKGKLKGKRVLLLGAGGAGMAIAFALAEKGSKLVITDREIGRAEALAKKLGAEAVELKDVGSVDAEIVINATPVGMHPNEGEMPVEESILKGKIVFDIVYHPVETKMLKAAKRLGCTAVGGLDMLVLQAASSFELWTGKTAPVDVMKTAVLKVLGKAD